MLRKYHTLPRPFGAHYLHAIVIPQLSFQDGEPEWSKVWETVLFGAAKEPEPKAQPGAR